MITDLKMLIETCKQELHDREYGGQHAAIIITEWDAVARWFQEKGLTEFNTESGYQYCDETIGAHIIVEGMTPRQKIRLRACRMLISYQKNGDFEFRSPRVERIFSGETGNLITQFIQHERAIGRSEKTIESREISLCAFNLYLQRFDLSFNDLSVDCIETFFKSMNYELAMRHMQNFRRERRMPHLR